MKSVRCSLTLILLVWLAFAAPIGQCIGADPPDKIKADPPAKVSNVKNSLEGVVQFSATISGETRTSEPVSLALRLKNLGKELLVFSDNPFEMFRLQVKTKEGAVVPVTRCLEDLLGPGKAKPPPVALARHVIIELAPGEEAGVTLPLSRMYDLSLHGDYVVSVEARFTVKRAPGTFAVENVPFARRHTPFVRITKVK